MQEYFMYDRDDVFSGSFQYVGNVCVEEPDDDGYRSISIINVKSKSKALAKLLEYHFTDRGRCSCSHDCCGCVSCTCWSAVNIPSHAADENLWAIHLSYARNI